MCLPVSKFHTKCTYYTNDTDIDDCAVNNGGCAQVCLNTLGSFSCACVNGFQLSGDGRNCSGKYTIVTLCFKQTYLFEYQH